MALMHALAECVLHTAHRVRYQIHSFAYANSLCYSEPEWNGTERHGERSANAKFYFQNYLLFAHNIIILQTHFGQISLEHSEYSNQPT